MLAVLVLALVLATYRATRLLTRDEMPLVRRPREWIIDRLGADHSLSYLIECPWCASPYLAAGIVWATHAAGVDVPYPWLLIPALSATTGLITRTLDPADEE